MITDELIDNFLGKYTDAIFQLWVNASKVTFWP